MNVTVEAKRKGETREAGYARGVSGQAPRRVRLMGAMTIAVLPVLLLGAGPFRGCRGDENETRPLPIDPRTSCFFDTDCMPAGCELLRCVAGECVLAAPFRDEDGDGFAPAPCGEDCNDSDRFIGPGQRELCDLVDQDCDDRIDEEAVPSALRFHLTTSDPKMAMSSWGGEIIVSDAAFTRRGIRTRRVDLRGTLHTVEPLFDTSRAILHVEADDTPSGAWFAVVLDGDSEGDAQELVLLEVARGDDGRVENIGDPIRRPVVDVESLSIISNGGEVFVGWDESDGARHIWSPSWGEAVNIEAGGGALDLETDGTHVVVAAGPRSLAFLARLDGALVSTVETSGNLAPGAPIASADSFVWAVINDAFGASIQRVDREMAGPTSTLLGSESHRFDIELTSNGLIVTRASQRRVRAWVLSEVNPMVVVRSWSADEIGGSAESITGVDVTETPNGTVILTNFGAAGSSLAVLACGTEM